MGLHTAAQTAPPVEEPGVVVKRLFDAYTQKNLDAFMGLWSADARDYSNRRETMKRIFSETGPLEQKELTIVRSRVSGAEAQIRVRVEITGLDPKTGTLHRDLGQMNRVVGLARTSDGWRVVRYSPADLDLASRLGAAASREERDRLLTEDKDLVVGPLVPTLLRLTDDRLAEGDGTGAARWADLSLEAAEKSGNADRAAECRRVRTSILDKIGKREPGELTPEEISVRKVVQNVLNACTAGDIDKTMSFWNSQAPGAPDFREFIESLLAANEKMQFREAQFTRCLTDGDRAGVRVEFTWSGRAKSTGKLISEPTIWNLRLLREANGWRLTKQSNAHNDLANALNQTDTVEQRVSLLTDEPKLLDPILLGMLHGWSSSHADRKNFANSLRINNLTLELAARLNQPHETGICFIRRGYLFGKWQREEDAMAAYRKALALFQQTKEEYWQAVALDNIGLSYRRKSRYKEAEASYTEALALARSAKNAHYETRILHALGLTYKGLNRPAEAMAAQEACLKVRQAAGDRAGEIEAIDAIGDLHRGGNQVEALAAYRKCVAIAKEIKHEAWVTYAEEKVANVLTDQGEHAEALALYEQCLERRRKVEDRSGEKTTLHKIGNLHLGISRWNEALKAYQASLAIALELGERSHEAMLRGAIGITQLDLGRPVEARASLEAGLKLALELKDRETEGVILGHLGILASDTGNYDEALRYYEASQAISRELGNARAVRNKSNNIANVLSKKGRSFEALKIYEEYIQEARKAGLPDDELTGLINVSSMYRDLGRFDEARQGLADALQLAKKLGNRPSEANILNSVGALHNSLAQYEAAKSAYTESLRIERSIGNRNGESQTLGNLATLANHHGRYTEALDLFQTAKKLAKEIGQREWEASALVGIGTVHSAAGRYADALLVHEEARAIYRAIGNPLEEANTCRHIAYDYEHMGRHAEALVEFQAALKGCLAVGYRKDEMWARGALAGAYHTLKRPAEALLEYEASLKIARELGDQSAVARSLGNLGMVYSDLGRKAEAKDAYIASLKMDREHGNRSGEAIALLNLGTFYFKENQFDEAMKSYLEALAISTRIGQANTTINAHQNLGLVHHRRKDWKKAEAEYRHAIAGVEKVRGHVREQSLQTGFFEQKVSVYYWLADCLQSAGAPADSLAVAEQAKARVLVDLLAVGKADVRKAMTGDERREEDRLAASTAEATARLLAAQSQPDRTAKQIQNLVEQLEGARNAEDANRRKLFLTHPELETQRATFAPATLKEMNRTLFADQPDLAVLSYLFVDNKDLLIFVITRGETPDGPARLKLHRVPIDMEKLKDDADTLRKACREPAGLQAVTETLYEWLITPAAADLEGKTHLVIIPDGVLHTLPFQALRDADKKFLIERFSLSYAPSVTALLKMRALADRRRRERGKDAGDLFVVGRPWFGNRHHDLPATEAEAKAVAALYGDRATLLHGASADKAAVSRGMTTARYVHLATHGLVNETNPLYSALAFSARSNGDDGLLYARDMIELDLKAELVVLSACNTALGRQTDGEGILGLTWAIFIAGSPSTIVSQWFVDDDSTLTLMEEFHRRLAAGKSKAESLREAQLQMLKTKATRRPFHWAAFTLVGDWGP